MKDHGYYGIYRAKVVRQGSDNQLVVQVPQLSGTMERTAEPCLSPDNTGPTTLPSVNDIVWVMFENGEANYPVWLGKWSK